MFLVNFSGGEVTFNFTMLRNSVIITNFPMSFGNVNSSVVFGKVCAVDIAQGPVEDCGYVKLSVTVFFRGTRVMRTKDQYTTNN